MTRLKLYLTDHTAGIVLLLIGVLIGVGGYFYLYGTTWLPFQIIRDFYANFSTELISIALTVLIIDYLNRRRQDQQLKAQLIREMGSGDNGFALRAVAELMARGWASDGSLRGIDLSRANLAGAELAQADLTSVSLARANLAEANLSGSQLSTANLWGCDLSRANLRAADLAEANLQEADLSRAWLLGTNLPGSNLRKANLAGAILEQFSQVKLDQVKSPVEVTIRERHRPNLQGAKYDHDTIWPEGFDPVEAGAVESSEDELARYIPKMLLPDEKSE